MISEAEILGGIDFRGDSIGYSPDTDYRDLASYESPPKQEYDRNLPSYYYKERPLNRLNTNNPFAQRIEINKPGESDRVNWIPSPSPPLPKASPDDSRDKLVEKFINISGDNAGFLFYLLIIVLAIFVVLQIVQIQYIYKLVRHIVKKKV